jgi:hypothetical protein
MSRNPTEGHFRKLNMFAKPDQRVAGVRRSLLRNSCIPIHRSQGPCPAVSSISRPLATLSPEHRLPAPSRPLAPTSPPCAPVRLTPFVGGRHRPGIRRILLICRDVCLILFESFHETTLHHPCLHPGSGCFCQRRFRRTQKTARRHRHRRLSPWPCH